ncbi:MAG TPA: MBL fold metallo-hydrolase [Sphingorhabdus sp.]|jgi:glyoxylase-like metal-dependent hydrolase (beta-lactamase superfamily II)|nr:MBL fold metallo-hydrolase [Sphingorhabdus sp.]
MASKPTPAYDASLADHGFEAKELKGLTYPLGDHAPQYGEIYPLAPDLGWTRMPVPGNLAHINIWLLDDDGGYAIADTGLFMPGTIEHWKAMFAGALADRELKRIFVTHFHPDHVGCAGWLANRHKVPIWMNRTEWLMARMLTSDIKEHPPEEVLARRRFSGWDEARIDAMRKGGWGNFARAVSRLPTGHVRMDEGQVIRVGKRDWTVMTGGGHTPEHACLVDFANGMIIAGDQILPRITSNVSMMDSEPEADPLGEWLASIAKFRAALPADMLVLPAHGEPFTGVHVRLDKLASGHHERLDKLEEALRTQEMRAVDTFALLFDRPIDDYVYGLATGEAQAHLRHLHVTERVVVEIRDGVGWYHAA